MSLGFANKITIGRILAVPFFIATVLYYSRPYDGLRYAALGIFLAAMVMDAVDGYIARRRHEKSRAGIILDPLADKLLLISAYICLYKVGIQFPVFRFPVWLVVAMISRDAILLFGSALMYMLYGHLPMEATVWGKLSTVCQVFIVVGVLLQWTVSMILWYPAVVLAVVSAVDYLHHGIRVINKNPQLRAAADKEA